MLQDIEKMDPPTTRRNRSITTIQRRDEKKICIKEWTSLVGITWSNVEDLLLWKNPPVSLVLFIFITSLFWSFISIQMKALGFVITAILFPCCFSDSRQQMWNYCNHRFQMQSHTERRRLAFNSNSIKETFVDWMVNMDDFIENLTKLNRFAFFLLILSYVIVIVVVYVCLPWAGIAYLMITLAYFYPILTYLDLGDILVKEIHKLREPFLDQWKFSRTRRTRDRVRGRVQKQNVCDTAEEYCEDLFVPLSMEESGRILDEEMRRFSSSSDDYGEFQFSDGFSFCHTSSSSDGDEDFNGEYSAGSF